MILAGFFRWAAYRALEDHIDWLQRRYSPAIVKLMTDRAVWEVTRPL